MKGKKGMRLFFKVFLFLQVIVVSAQAQYTVQGVVTDSLTNEPLSYTSVYLKERRKVV